METVAIVGGIGLEPGFFDLRPFGLRCGGKQQRKNNDDGVDAHVESVLGAECTAIPFADRNYS